MNALQELEFALSEKMAVLLVGPSGRGKTFIAEHHQVPDGGIVKIPMTPQTEENPLYGSIVFDVATQAYRHIDGPLVVGVSGPKPKRIVADEVTSAPADVSHLWHQVANRENFPVKTDGYRMVEIDPGHQLIGTTNLEGYAGNYRLSPAFYSRWHIIKWFGMSVAQETEYFTNLYPDLDPLNIAAFVDLGHKLASKIGVQQTEFVVGMREIDRACKFYRHLQKVDTSDKTPHVTAFVKCVRRPCSILATDMLGNLDKLAEQSFRADYARAKAREQDSMEEHEAIGVAA